jgi:hypothetical protein
MSLVSLYIEMLNAPGGQLSAEMQNRIVEFAKKRKNTTILSKLAHYPGLAPEVDGVLRGYDDLSVLTAWATRPGRTGEELRDRLLGEKRVSALLPLAEQQGLGDEVYKTIARISSAKLAEALASNTGAPIGVRVAKVKEFVSKSPRGAYNRHDERLHTMCRCTGANTPDQERRLYEAVADTTYVVPYIKACLQRPYVRSTDIDKWIANLEAYYLFDDRAWQAQVGDLVILLGQQVLTATQRLNLLAKSTELADKTGSNWYTQSLRRAVETLGNFDEGVAKAFAALEEATSDEEFRERTDALRSICSTEDLPRIAGLMARHHSAPVDLSLAYLPHMKDRTDLERLVVRIEARGDIDGLTALLRATENGGYLPQCLRFMQAKTATKVLDTYVEAVIAQDRPLPAWFIETEYLAHRPDLAIANLQWTVLNKAVGKNRKVAAMVEKTILEHLGTSPEAWEAFHTLAEGYEGSLTELLGAATALG